MFSHDSAVSTATLGLVLAMLSGAGAGAGSLGCNSPKETQEVSSVATTQSAAVRPRAYSAAECQKPELKRDERCDWYYDPMSGSQPGDAPESAPPAKH